MAAALVIGLLDGGVGRTIDTNHALLAHRVALRLAPRHRGVAIRGHVARQIYSPGHGGHGFRVRVAPSL